MNFLIAALIKTYDEMLEYILFYFTIVKRCPKFIDKYIMLRNRWNIYDRD